MLQINSSRFVAENIILIALTKYHITANVMIPNGINKLISFTPYYTSIAKNRYKSSVLDGSYYNNAVLIHNDIVATY